MDKAVLFRAWSKLPTVTLVILVALLVSVIVSRPGFSLPTVVLFGAVALLVLWHLKDAAIPVITLERICGWLVWITAFFGAALFPIDLGPFTLFPFRIFLLLLWALFITRTLIGGKVVLPASIAGIKRYLQFLSFWLFYATLSLGWAVDKVAALRHIVFLLMGCSVVFFTVYYFHEWRDLRRLFWTWVGAFAVLLVIGLWEHLTGRHLPGSGYYEERLFLLKEYVRQQVMWRPTGVFKNPNDYATFLVLSIPFALSSFRYLRSKLVRLAALGSMILAFYFVLIVGSRANMVAVLLELTFVWLFLTRINQKIKVTIASLACLGLILVLSPVPIQHFFSGLTGQLGSIVEQAKLGTESVGVRINLARNGLLYLYSTAGFGVGSGNAEYWMANFARYDTAGILNLHNWWLEVLIDYGVFIFAGYIVMYFGLIRRLWCSWHKTIKCEERMIVEALLVSLVGFAVASISSSSIMAFMPHWLLFAFAIALSAQRGLRRA